MAATERPVRIGVQIPQYGATWAQLRDAATAAEDLGADVLFTWDHFFGPKDTDVPHFECWSVLAAWAELTSRLELGPLVAAIGYRNPDLLADMARTVDHIAGGRVVLGVGSGFKQRDYEEYGFEFGTPGSRVGDLERGVPRIRERLARLQPPPLRHMPLLVAGGGEQRTLRIVAEHADIWHTFADGEEFAHKSAVLDGHCARIGRSPAEIERSVLVRDDPEQVGPEFLARGATLFVVSIRELDLAPLTRWVRWRDRL